MKRLGRIILITTILLIFAGGIVFLVIRLIPEPPYEEIKQAIEAISKASSSQASAYSPQLFSEAEVAYDSAMAKWKRENSKFIFFRNYDKVAKYAILARQKAYEATRHSDQNSRNLEEKLIQKLADLEETNSEITRIFSAFPASEEYRLRLSKGRILLKEAEIDFHNRQFLKAYIKITDAGYMIESVYDKLMADINSYFRSFPVWQKWVETSINNSRKNRSYLILVDKYAHKCYVYHAGIKKFEFEADLGRNWAEDKMVAGDRVTPEGMYKIVAKYQGGSTKYYKALRLDYPNDEDMERFRVAKSNGILHNSARPGGGIEIHGDGGKGTDWTDGCIALRNTDMDKIFPFVSNGTPVTIVGSIRSLDEILNNGK